MRRSTGCEEAISGARGEESASDAVPRDVAIRQAIDAESADGNSRSQAVEQEEEPCSRVLACIQARAPRSVGSRETRSLLSSSCLRFPPHVCDTLHVQRLLRCSPPASGPYSGSSFWSASRTLSPSSAASGTSCYNRSKSAAPLVCRWCSSSSNWCNCRSCVPRESGSLNPVIEEEAAPELIICLLCPAAGVVSLLASGACSIGSLATMPAPLGKLG